MAATVAMRRRAVSPAVYRRRQLVALAILAVVVVALAALAGWLGGGPLPASEPASAPPVELVAQRTYVVQPGDTLWSIARALQPTGDVRPLVQRLADEQGHASLRVGDRISLP